MEVMFYVVPGLIMAVALLMGYKTIRHALQLRSAWTGGVTAKGCCLKVFTTTRGGSGDSSVSTTLHHVYEFTARDGRVIRFDERGGPATRIEGDFVTVYYTEGDKVFATAEAPGHGKNVASALFMVLFVGAILVFSVVFMVSFATDFAG